MILEKPMRVTTTSHRYNKQQTGGNIFMKEKKQTEPRNKNWGSVVYEESAPPNWKTILDEQNIPALISPLHDKDENDDGSLKKAHFHIIIMFDGQKTRAQAKAVFSKIGGVGIESINSLKGYSRYLAHLDNPEKFQYNPKEIVALSGANYNFAIQMPGKKYEIISDILEYCMVNSIHSYADLILYARGEQPEWFSVLCDSSHMITQFLKSLTWTTLKKPSLNI